MSDLYTCSVCGLKIDLDNLTEHVLLHEEYSAFTYNETSKVIEPLINAEEENRLHLPNESGDAPIEVIRPDLSAGTAYQPPSVNYHTIPAGSNPVSLYESNFVPSDRFVEIEKTYTNSNTIEAPQKSENAEYASSVCLDSVGSLSGIRLIANAAESLSRTTNEQQVEDHPSASNIGSISRSSTVPISVQRPLNPGDIIDTICLPYLGSTESERLFCECSIVFNRFVTEANAQSASSNSTQSFPQYRNFYTHTYDGNGGVSLQDLVDEDTESDNGYEFGEGSTNGESIVGRNQRFSRHGRPTTPRGNRAGYKMKVYQYKEPLVKSDVKKELSKNVVPELLKNPAVAKYLEKMKESSVNETEEVNDSGKAEQLINTTENGTTDVSKGDRNELSGNIIAPDNRGSATEACSTTNENEMMVSAEHFVKRNEDTIQSVPLVSNSDDGCNLHIEHDEEGIKIVYTKPNVIVENTNVPGGDMITIESQESSELQREKIAVSSLATESEQNVDSLTSMEEAAICLNVELSEEGTLSCTETNMDCDSVVNIEEQRGGNQCGGIGDSNLSIKGNELAIVSSDIKEKLENSICEEIESFKDELFYCMLCDVILPSKPKLKKHMQEHKLEKPMKENIVKLDGTYACEDLPECGNDDLEAGDITEDMEYEMDDLQQEVDDLEHGLIIEKTSLRRSSKRRSDPYWVKENMLKKMRKKGSTRKAFICDNCGDSFDFVFDNLKHVARCSVQTSQLKCFQGCGQVFKTKSELDYHKNFCSRRIAYRERMYDIFEKIKKSAGDDFMDYIDPSLHLDDESKLITCRNCDEVFTFEELCIHSDDCMRESRLAEVKNEERFECQYCQRINLTSEKNRLHELVCKKRPLQQCDYCEFSCKGSKPMSIHLVSQHNVNPYQCELCPKAFKLKSSLKSHVKYAHTKETITCEYCGKSFCKQSIYRSHVSIQHEGFRFLCRYCDKPFKDKRTWLTHENSHKGAYDYACSVCKKTFNKSSKYKDHMKEFHSIDGEAALVINSTARELRDKLCTNICNICGEKFPLKTAYSHHMVKEHGMSVDE